MIDSQSSDIIILIVTRISLIKLKRRTGSLNRDIIIDQSSDTDGEILWTQGGVPSGDLQRAREGFEGASYEARSPVSR